MAAQLFKAALVIDVIDVGRFFAERQYSTVVLLVVVVTALLILFISWPWLNVILVSLWAAYILWFPARWLERRIHRRVLSSFVIMLLIIVVYVLMLFQVVYILANELTSFQISTTTANATLTSAFAHYLGGQTPVVTNVTVNAGQAGSQVLTAFANAALGIVEGVIRSTPLYLFQLFIVTILVWYLIVNGDRVAAEFKSLAPRAHQNTLNAFFSHLDAIYHALYVNYIFAALISGIIALFFFPLIGVPYAITAAFLMFTVGIVPVIGRALVYIPVSLYFLIIGDPAKALWVLIVSVILFQIVVGLYIIPFLGHRGRAGIPKPVALLAYVVPFAAIGLLGVIVGPAVYGFALALYRTYRGARKEGDSLADHSSLSGEAPP
ncbi:MAG TPA: AI-2E family transporter [Candidatus Acidoferrales bacterium]|nr:AI-2E family transporter [Candidatus Acidoferrales bacterium]